MLRGRMAEAKRPQLRRKWTLARASGGVSGWLCGEEVAPVDRRGDASALGDEAADDVDVDDEMASILEPIGD